MASGQLQHGLPWLGDPLHKGILFVCMLPTVLLGLEAALPVSCCLAVFTKS